MRHSIIAAIALVIVAAYSFFTFFYVSGFTKDICQPLEAAEIAVTSENVTEIRMIFEKKKKMLNFLINKEHLDEVENNITALESCVRFGDVQKSDEYLNLLKNSVEDIKRHNKSII